MNIRTEKLQIRVPGEAEAMPAYLAVPEGAGPHPAVLVIEEIFGVNAHIRDITERVAREGYLALAPDIHHRAAPPGMELNYDEAGMQQGMQLIAKLTQEGVLADLNASLGFLRARADVRGDRIGCVGFCIGGHIAYLAACTTDVRATASFYGGGVATFSPGGGTPTVNRTSGITGKIVCFFGGKDQMIPKAHVQAIATALEQHKIKHEIVVYPDATHGFFCDQRASFDPASRDDAWQRVKKLFAEELRDS